MGNDFVLTISNEEIFMKKEIIFTILNVKCLFRYTKLCAEDSFSKP